MQLLDESAATRIPGNVLRETLEATADCDHDDVERVFLGGLAEIMAHPPIDVSST